MKLKKLWIENFKNLQNLEIDFGSHLTTVILGGNGTGKSNLLEALAIIFRDLDLELKSQGAFPFEYWLVYECRGHIIEIDANPSQTRHTSPSQLALMRKAEREKKRRSRLQITIDGKKETMKHFFANKQEYLPNHVFGYYSGPTNRLVQHFDQHQRRFYEEQRQGVDSPLRPLFFALPVHSQFVLLAYFSFPDVEDLRFLQEYMGITELESVLFVAKQPDWARARYPDDLFWGAEGIPRQFLQDLYDAALEPIRETVKVPIRTGKSTDEEWLYLYIKDQGTLRQVARKRGSNQEFFKALDTLYIADLIAEVRIRVKHVGAGESITFTELSEGEQQLLTVLGLIKFTRDTETLFLLDEPDTHLNPAWKLEYMGWLEPIVGRDTQCQILLATHDPVVIGSCLKEQVRVLAFEGGDRSGKVLWYEPDDDPRGMGVSALLTSDVYGLRSSLDWETQKKLDRKRELAAKKPGELTKEEIEELKRLSSELEDLGFTYHFRDPLYTQFVEAMTEEMERYPELKQTVLTKEEQELQASLAREIVAELKAESQSEQSL